MEKQLAQQRNIRFTVIEYPALIPTMRNTKTVLIIDECRPTGCPICRKVS